MKTKTGIFALVALSVLELTIAQPHGHPHHKRGLFGKREIVTDIEVVTAPEVVVYVDMQGNTISVYTETPGQAAATPIPSSIVPAPTVAPTSESSNVATPSQTPSAAPIEAFLAPASSAPAATASSAPTTADPPVASTSAPSPNDTIEKIGAAPETAAAPAVTATPAVKAAPVIQASSNNDKNNHQSTVGTGITYSAYRADSSCKSTDQMNAELSALTGYHTIRIYGVDCNQVAVVASFAASHGMTVFAGVYDIHRTMEELTSMQIQLNDDWTVVSTVSIGNEVVQKDVGELGNVIAALGTARGFLAGTNFKGSVVTVDTFVAHQHHPELCANSDFCAANCHAFFNDGTTTADQAGTFVKSILDGLIRDISNGKQVVITESGWPHAGSPNGAAVPSPENQATAMASLNEALGDSFFAFTSYDEAWKIPGAWGVEQFWGIYGH